MFDFVQRAIDRNQADARRFAVLEEDVCQLCGATGPDKRSLRINCFYDVSEVIPEAINLNKVEGEAGGWYLRICKSCRGGLLGHLRTWRNEMLAKRGEAMDSDGRPEDEDPERTIPMRVNGATVMMARAEYDQWTSGGESPSAVEAALQRTRNAVDQANKLLGN